MSIARKEPRVDWVVASQSLSPTFQLLLGRLCQDFGPCRLLTGARHPVVDTNVAVKRGPGYDRRGIFQRIVSWVRFSVFASGELLRVGRGQFVLVTTNPPMLPHMAAVASRLRGFQYAVLVWDIYPEHLVMSGLVKPESSVVKLWGALNCFAFARARTVVTIGHRMSNVVASYFADPVVARHRVRVVPNIADTEFLKPLQKEHNTFAREQGQVDKFTVLYSGNLGATHELKPLLEAANLLRFRDDIEFLIIGDGLGRRALEEAATDLGLENVRFVARQPWEMLPYTLATADLAVVSQAPGTEELSVPSKTYSYLASGAPLLAMVRDQRTDIARLVIENGVGVVCDPERPEEVAKCIERLASGQPALGEMKRAARQVAERSFSLDVIHTEFAAALKGGAETRSVRSFAYGMAAGSEMRLLTLATKNVLSATEVDELLVLLDTLSQDSVVTAARANQVETMVASTVSRFAPSQLPVAWVLLLERNLKRVQRMTQAAAVLFERLAEQGGSAALIEAGGVLLSSDVSLEAYAPGDMDILVDPAYERQAENVLLDMGFVEKPRRAHATTRREYCREGSDGIVERLSVATEPFERVWMPWLQPNRAPEWLSRRRRSQRIPEVFVLAPHDALAQVAIHTSLHAYVREPGLRLHADVDWLVRSNEIRWEGFVSEIRAMRCETRAFFSLAMAVGILDTPVPDAVLKALYPGDSVWHSVRAVLRGRGFLASGQRKMGRLATLGLEALLSEQPVRRWIQDNVFPPTEWMLPRYGAGVSERAWRLHLRRYRSFTRWSPV